MRIFIGIKLEQSVHEAIEKFLKPFKKLPTPVRWVKPENVHLTLKFIGDVPDDKYSRIEDSLTTDGLADGALDIKLTGCGKFGKKESLNIFWLGVEPNRPLETFYYNIEDALHKIGFEKETRRFKPHITVGRNKKTFNFKSFFKLIDEYGSHPIHRFTASHFQVFKSDLKPEGPIYTILKEIPLTDAQA
jgi:2'-5' RNA ligase